jgi:fermentation-respiration switch protein FrsA (DUF1100 family)
MRPRRLSSGRGRAVVVLAVALLAGCGDNSTPSTTAETTLATASAGGYEIESTVETLVDDTRPTPPNGSFAGAPDRTIETKIFRPVLPEGGDATDGFPLIVFSHGIDDDDERYTEVLAEWAEAGYVVAAPNFPLSRKSAPGGPTLADLDNQPGDLQFVTDEIRRLSSDGDHDLAGLVGDRTALAGKSFGAITTLTAVYGADPIDGPIDAVVSMAGAMDDPSGAGRVETPLLLIHGELDERVPYRSSVDVFAAANPPKYLLTLLDEGHTGAYNGGESPVEELVPQAALDFFDAYLKDDDAAVDRLIDNSEIPAVSTIEAEPG